MDALEAADARRFERHLTRCPECRDEIAGLRETAGRLAGASAERPPDGLKERILVAAERTRQLPPAIGDTIGGWPARMPGIRLPRLAAAIVAVLAVVAAAIWVAGGPGRPGQPPRQTAAGAIAAVLTAADAVIVDAPIRTSGTATVVMSLRERKLVFAASGLRSPRAGRCYELWLMDHGRDRPAGLLPMPSHGMTGPVIATGLHRGDKLGLSVEPATGSGHPTSPMLLVLAL
jgi:anti-sigma-K factor RskA